MKKTITLLTLVFCYSTNAQIISTVAGNNTLGYCCDNGQAISAELHNPSSVAHDASGNLYIVDQLNNRIRKVNASGVITTIAGNGTAGFTGDGGQAIAAELNGPTCVALDPLGNIYIADAANNRIRMINGSGVISTVVGTGTAGFSGDSGPAPAAELNHPVGILFAGNVGYIADASNNRIRMINGSGTISTIAGNGTAGYSGDGAAATAAKLNGPASIAIDAAGNLYISDYTNNRIRKITAAGIISTYAGNGIAGSTGDGGAATAAEISGPSGIALDGAGNLYIPDYNNNKVRKVSATGTMTTIAGTGVNSYFGDGGLATAARLSGPRGVCFDNSGNLYIADDFNNVIRMVTNVGQAGIEQFTGINEQVTVYPNPAKGEINVTMSQFNHEKKSSIEIYNLIGECVHRQVVTSPNCQINVSDFNEGVYNVNIISNEGVVNKRIVVVK